MNREKVLNLLNDLKISKNEYTVLSSSSLVLRGIYDKCGDIDIAVTNEGFEELKKNYSLVSKGNNWYKINDEIECVIDEEVSKEKYKSFNVQNINQYYEYIKSANREKDKERIEVLNSYFEIYNYFKNNIQEMYKLIEVRNNNFEAFNFDNKLLKVIRENLLIENINNIINLCKDKEVYVLGHNNPDADSLVSSYILSNILKSKGIKAHFSVLNKNYDYTFHDKKLLEDNFKYNPEVVGENNYFILTDHNDLQGLIKENVIGSFDHHRIRYEIDNIVEIEYASTSLLIYDLFKEEYNFNKEEKRLIALATLSDSDYLTSSRFTDIDRRIFNELELDEDVKELQLKYFATTDFSLGVSKNFEINKKEYLRNDKKITRIQITSYDDNHLDEYINKAKELNYLLIWVNYKDETTTICFNDRVIKLDYLLSSTFLVFELLEKENELTKTRRLK